MAGIEYRRQPDTGLEGGNHYSVHFVVDDVADLTEIDGVDHLIVAIFLITVKVLGLTTMACASVSEYYRIND
jgi:hypothetical protein